MLRDAPAWSADTLDRIENDLDEALARKWVPLQQQALRRERALSHVASACTLRRGSLFVTPRAVLYRFRRNFARVTCPDGREAWTRWTSTRLESVVRPTSAGLVIEQVVLVECDTPTIERRVITTNAHLGFSLGSCGD
jgi:hypothetical protein